MMVFSLPIPSRPMPRTTRIIPVDPHEPDPAVLSEAAETLRRGGLVAFATETVYGLGADATDLKAVAQIFEAKDRPAFNPLIVHADGLPMVRSCVAAWPDSAQRLAARFWPGPLTLVLPRSKRIPDLVTAGRETVGVRIPRVNIARRLIEAVGRPIAAPSANRSTRISPTLAAHVLQDMDGRIDLILDSGQTALGLESTVVDLTSRPPRVLRPGPILAEGIAHACEGLCVHESVDDPPTDRPASPGQMAIHYAPRTRSVRVEEPRQLAGLAWPGRAATHRRRRARAARPPRLALAPLRTRHAGSGDSGPLHRAAPVRCARRGPDRRRAAARSTRVARGPRPIMARHPADRPLIFNPYPTGGLLEVLPPGAGSPPISRISVVAYGHGTAWFSLIRTAGAGRRGSARAREGAPACPGGDRPRGSRVGRGASGR